MTVSVYGKVPYIKTPLVYSNELSQKTPCQVFLKQEFIQPSGSYKIRGLSNHIRKELENIRKISPESKVTVIAASGGNAGNAVSYAAKFFGLASVIVVPVPTPVKMRQKMEANGSKVIPQGNNIGEAEEYARTQVMAKFSTSQATIYCHPYDLENIWEGHSSLIDEISSQLTEMSQLNNLKGVVSSIGGGGLYNGLVRGLEKNNLSNVPVMTLETDSCPTFQKGIEAGSPVHLKSFNSIAVSLACPYISAKSLENYRNHKTNNQLVTDSDAAEACIRFASDSNIIVEPACGVALCSVYKNILAENAEFFGGLTKDDIVVIIVCGGSITTFDDLSRYRQIYQL